MGIHRALFILTVAFDTKTGCLLNMEAKADLDKLVREPAFSQSPSLINSSHQWFSRVCALTAQATSQEDTATLWLHIGHYSSLDSQEFWVPIGTAQQVLRQTPTTGWAARSY